MGLNPDGPEAGESRLEHAKMAARIAIAGHEQAAVRRIVLWCVLMVAIVGEMLTPLAIFPAMLAAMLLVSTDQLV